VKNLKSCLKFPNLDKTDRTGPIEPFLHRRDEIPYQLILC
jgi:hypothetical protein